MTGGVAEKTVQSTVGADARLSEFDLLPGAFNETSVGVSERQRLPARLTRLYAAAAWAKVQVTESIGQEAEFGHLFYWAPVLLGCGAAFWFTLDVTPSLAPSLLLCAGAASGWLLLGPWRPGARAVALAIGLLALGALLAAWQTARANTIMLDGPVTTTVRGIVTGREIDSLGRWRYAIQLMETERPALKRRPDTIFVTALGKGDGIPIGEGLEGRARLSPPSGPALSGLNDFAFDAYFNGTGAYGFFYGRPKPWSGLTDTAIGNSLYSRFLQALGSVQGQISGRIRSLLPGDSGAFAASMVTDDRRAMSKETTEALRLAGLTHIIAISGLNMALAAGLFFIGFRTLLSLSQEISHRWPVKKIAAAGAMVTVTLYYLISGFSVSAERAYIMMTIMLAAVFFGRPSISLRNVALSAIVILILSPSALLGPGFQMSYAATIALVAGYSAVQRRMQFAAPTGGVAGLKRIMPAWNFMVGVFMTSLIGGMSTALYSVEHFHRIATWGLPANLLAMPVISFIVMPAGLFALVLMPFGLDWIPLAVMGQGLDFVIAVAKWVASQKGEWVTGRIPAWLFVGMSIGLLVVAILRSRLRYIGAAVAGGLLLLHLALPDGPTPALVIYEDGALAGIVGRDGIAISQKKPSDFILEQWQRALGIGTVFKPHQIKAARTPVQSDKRPRLTPDEVSRGRREMRLALATTPVDRFTCIERHWCAARMASGLAVIIAINGGYAGGACDMADIVITPARLKWGKCRSGAALYSGESLRRSGSLEIFIDEHDFEPPTVRVVGALEGRQRDWTLHRRYDWRSGTFLTSAE